MTRSLILILVGGFVLSTAPAMAKPAPDPAAGREAYVTNCARCHGDTGRGDGPDAARMVPRPRDFTMGTYKFRTTASGTPPTDDDLFRTISYGLAGTRMPAWEGLSEETRWQLVSYLKSLSPKFAQGTPQPVEMGKDPGPRGIELAKGKKLYADLGCAACHGTLGRANGPSAKTLTDDWAQPIRPANLTQGWSLRGGAEPKDLVARLMTGVDGTPMPSYGDTVSKEDLWQLAYYLRSIQEPVQWGWSVTAVPVATLPASPTDAAWETAPRTDIKLWSNLYQNGAVVPANIPWAMIQAVATAEAVAFRVAWDDPTQDAGATPDHLALVFKPATAGWEIGSLQSWPRPDAPALDVILWSAAASAAREAVATGFDLPNTAQTLPTQAQYADGRWWVTVTRPRTIPDGAALQAGVPVPLALVAWDSGRSDTGRQRSVSTWCDVSLAATTTTKETSHETH